MIESLSISNYALIDYIELDFTPGLNIVTGETGAGKSIMLGALSMLLGNRADTRVVTDKSKKSVVEAVFNIEANPAVNRLLEINDIDTDDRRLILRREITPTGRSRSFVNDMPVQLATLREIALRLVDIHSQHQNLLLSTPEYQLKIIDTLLPDDSVRTRYAEAYEHFRQAMRKYQAARRAVESSKAEEEYFRFRLQKLDSLQPHEGEQAELEQQRDTLANISSIKLSLRRLTELFADGEENIDSMLRTASAEMANLDGLTSMQGIDERIESLRIEAADLASTFESAESSLEANPELLEQIDERLSDLYDAQRSFGVGSVDELIEQRRILREKIDAIDSGDDRMKELAIKAKSAKKAAVAIASELSEARKAVAVDFGARLRDNASSLGMKNLQVEVSVAPAELSASGADDVNLLVAFNKNQPLMPVKDTASGGEISRLMLTVKAIVADRMQMPSIIFDEIDTGVSGDVANRMGQLMKGISRRIQVISITHLPQIASKGDSHYKVYKEDSDVATNTRVRRLAESERVGELALMLSGDAANDAARATAQTLLNDK